MKSTYNRVQCPLNNDDYIDSQFEIKTKKFPLKAISFAIFLFIFGSILIVFSILNLIGHITSESFNRYIVLLILGFIMFIPGFYHVSIAYLAFKKFPGFSFNDIIDFD